MSDWNCRVCGFNERYTLSCGAWGGCKQCARSATKRNRDTPARRARIEVARAERSRRREELRARACSQCAGVPIECNGLCKRCYQRAGYAADPAVYRVRSVEARKDPKIKEREKNRKLRNPESNLLYEARKRSRRHGVPCSISTLDIVIPTHCPILNIPLAVSKGVLSPGSPSLDRIIPGLGCVRGNIQVISHKANTMKSNATPDQLEKFAKWILSMGLDIARSVE